MAINEHTIVPKLAFAIFGDASADSLVKLERIFLNNAVQFSKGRPDNPSSKQIGAWMKGRPLVKLGHYRFFKIVVEETVADEQFYETLQPDQKKVFKQVDRFLEKRITGLDIAGLDSAGIGQDLSKRVGATRWLEIKLMYDALADNLASVRDELQEERPNHPDSAFAIEKSIEIVDLVEAQLGRIDAVLVSSLKQASSDDEELRSVVGQVADEFRTWVTENSPEVVDAVMRLTPATAFLGLLGLAGANMAWATPIVLAICGGKPVVDVLKSIKK